MSAHSSEGKSYPPTENIKKALKALGFERPWASIGTGEKQIIENGEIWLRNNDYFAVLGVSDTDENGMHMSLMNNLTTCAKLGMAITGESSSIVFKKFGSLTKNALTEPEQKIRSGDAPFYFHVLVTELIANKTLMQCGVSAGQTN
ncbi:hypothetical protein L4D06_18065 [Enterovibrio makurazakiensis]|uniref:Uncharacterized protein n=1 Tax=Enterovibrio gelatinilyticus TaxID=2899819 RepID=A0ABT5R4C2_9GAMM|nr:hypothetical protein [Enterovibrio sp. ZSDZ42]MDD1794621.1 hypothetical protein [Enterovibrio sp. ZSDZ42]